MTYVRTGRARSFCARGESTRRISDVNRRAMALTCHAQPSRLAHRSRCTTGLPFFSPRFFPYLYRATYSPCFSRCLSSLSYLIIFSFSIVCVHSDSRTSKTPAFTYIVTVAGRYGTREYEGGRGDGVVVCHSSLSSPISWQFRVVHKLSPLCARAYPGVQKWWSSRADIAAKAAPAEKGDGSRERCRLIFSHRINPAPASRRGLILHGRCQRPCVGRGEGGYVRVRFRRTLRYTRSPTHRPIFPRYVDLRENVRFKSNNSANVLQQQKRKLN